MLLERGMAAEALAAFEATLKKEPNRLGAYLGAAKAASKIGDQAKAKQYGSKVIALTKEADTSRPEVQDSRPSRPLRPQRRCGKSSTGRR